MNDEELNNLNDVNIGSVVNENTEISDEIQSTYRMRIDWNYESRRKDLSEAFMHKYAKFLNWEVICANRK